MIVIWVMELYLVKLEQMRLAGLEQTATYADLQKEFDVFLALDEISNCIKNNKGTVYNLMSSHGDKNNVLKLTILNKNFEQVSLDQKYELSAQRYAETESSLEEICLKFIEANQHNALKLFLRCKLDTLKPQDKTQITMIVIWVMELYLVKLEQMRLAGLEQTATYADLQKEFDVFLALDEISNCIKNNKGTVYNLMSSHGDKNNVLKLTILNKNFEQIIQQHIFKNNFHDALDVLKSQKNYDIAAEDTYRSSLL
uniref:Vacuolar protein sorting-associated protein 18 homolog n=1 Tax=Diabrotica virgifera virgifera TaxID=50390 RepID=A0A6P7GRY3_DIAVI